MLPLDFLFPPGSVPHYWETETFNPSPGYQNISIPSQNNSTTTAEKRLYRSTKSTGYYIDGTQRKAISNLITPIPHTRTMTCEVVKCRDNDYNSTLTLLQTSYNTFRLQARYIALARFNRIKREKPKSKKLHGPTYDFPHFAPSQRHCDRR